MSWRSARPGSFNKEKTFYCCLWGRRSLGPGICTGPSELSFDILDLRTLLPLDYTAILASVGRTGKALVLHEDTLTGGIGAEVAAWIAEQCFHLLDAPVSRCASLDTPVPFIVQLENNFLGSGHASR